MWKILIAVVFLFQTSVLMGDEQASDTQNSEVATEVATAEQNVVVITDPDIAATEDEEPDCE